jgi:hypothetical protein
MNCPACGKDYTIIGCDCIDKIKPGEAKPKMVVTNYGWQCPRCFRCHAPWMPSCDCHVSLYENMSWRK